MDDPSLPLQGATYTALTAEFGDEVGVYDDVPTDPTTGAVKAKYPFIEIGQIQIVGDPDQCHDAMRAYHTVHVWSRAVGGVEAKSIMRRVCRVLSAKLDVEGFGVISGEPSEGPHHLKGGDGKSRHSVATFEYRMAAGQPA